ncbi:MAG: hypothetical protein OXK77_02915 [Gemmatimonadota bacterium]|nr:hypothetical protein [Gemmatimonadota bacterium]MDE2864117.1 hypothetical protein [Gemmatimonadota bacterium]
MKTREVVNEFLRGWDEVRQLGRVEVLVQQIGTKFGRRTAEEARQLLLEDPDGDRIGWAIYAILDRDKAEDFLAGLRLRGD